MYQEVIDTTASESEFVETECEVEVCEKSSFVNIEDIKIAEDQKRSLPTTWPIVAAGIMKAMYGSMEEKKIAIKAFLNLFQFEQKNIEPIRFMTKEMSEIYEKYKTKLNLYETYLVKLKNMWCDILKTCAVACRMILEEKQSVCDDLKEKAKEIYSENKSSERAVYILSQEFRKTIEKINYFYDQKIEIAKLKYAITKIEPNYEENVKLDLEIRQLMKKYEITESVQEDIKVNFENECANIDWTIAKAIEQECQQYWMDALSIKSN